MNATHSFNTHMLWTKMTDSLSFMVILVDVGSGESWIRAGTGVACLCSLSLSSLKDYSQSQLVQEISILNALLNTFTQISFLCQALKNTLRILAIGFCLLVMKARPTRAKNVPSLREKWNSSNQLKHIRLLIKVTRTHLTEAFRPKDSNFKCHQVYDTLDQPVSSVFSLEKNRPWFR